MNVNDNKNNDYPYYLIFKNGNNKGGKILKFVENRISYLKDEWQHPGVCMEERVNTLPQKIIFNKKNTERCYNL